MNRKLICKSNYVLRKVINKEENVDILQDLIEAILEIKIKKIELNPYLIKKKNNLPQEENFGIADVRLVTDKDEEMNVGLQFIDGKYVETKLLIYYAQIHENQLEYQDRELAKTITINFLDFERFDTTKYKRTIKVKCREANLILEELEIITIELPKFKIKDENNITKKEAWIDFLKGDKEKIITKIKKENKKIQKLDYLLEDYWDSEKME